MQDVFPAMPIEVILEDLRVTHSVEMTIENIIEGRLQAPPTQNVSWSYSIVNKWPLACCLCQTCTCIISAAAMTL